MYLSMMLQYTLVVDIIQYSQIYVGIYTVYIHVYIYTLYLKWIQMVPVASALQFQADP